MPIIGVNFRSIEAKAEHSKDVSDVKIDSSPKINNIEKKDEFFGIKNVLIIDFSFTTKYDPKVGFMKMEGDVIYQADDHKKIMDNWKKDKKIEGQMAVDVLNAIFKKCIVKAIDLSSELRLPPPIQMPTVQPKAGK
jgi:predicted nicotinamide N-methyase